ncbi:unnamed protein product [Arabidopsis lyrata]|nr:unnamed protein product [Arabidopsis lyrata]
MEYYQPVEINVLSAQDLDSVNLLFRPTVYVSVSVTRGSRDKQVTPAAACGHTFLLIDLTPFAIEEEELWNGIRYPVALIVQVDVKFLKLGQEGVYHLPKKHPITKDTRLHCMLLIGYGVTKEGKTFFIGQNSYGKGWGCKGYAIIIIDKKCDIVCQKD